MSFTYKQLVYTYLEYHDERFHNIIYEIISGAKYKIILFGHKSNGKTTLKNILLQAFPRLNIVETNVLPNSLEPNEYLFQMTKQFVDEPNKQLLYEMKKKTFTETDYSRLVDELMCLMLDFSPKKYRKIKDYLK